MSQRHVDQSGDDLGQVEAAIDPVHDLREIALGVLGANRITGAAQRRLDVAENRVHSTKLGTLDRGFPVAGHHRLMHAACRGHAIEAGQPIAEHLRARTQVLLRPGGDFSETEALDSRPR